MAIETVDLLYPVQVVSETSRTSDRHAERLPETTSRDLRLDRLSEWLGGDIHSGSEVLRTLAEFPQSIATITYRQDILFDLYEAPHLRERLLDLLPKLREITVFSRTASESDEPLLQAIWRLGELELFTECINALHQALSDNAPPLRSEGLRRLRAYVDGVRESDTFEELQKELPALRSGLKNKRSVTVGINLDDRLRPVEAGLVGIHSTPFHENRLLSGFLSRVTDGDRFALSAPLHKTPDAQSAGLPSGTKIPLSALFQDLHHLLRSVSRPLVRAVERYLNVQTTVLRNMANQIAFYLGGARVMSRLAKAGLPVCRPQLCESEKGRFHASEFYNLDLARRLIDQGNPQDIVTNEVAIGEPHHIFVLTGPNQGGKTTYVRGLGIAQVWVQSGLFAPASRAEISPADTILTHFPQAEHALPDTGRFSEETGRLSELLGRLTPNSFLLLNETLASTSPSEAVVLSREILSALRMLGTRSILATHFHEIAQNLEELNGGQQGRTSVGSLQAGVSQDDGDQSVHRTYRIEPGPPASTSYARDIAVRHGLSFEQIVEQFSRRGLLP